MKLVNFLMVSSLKSFFFEINNSKVDSQMGSTYVYHLAVAFWMYVTNYFSNNL